MSPQNLRCVPGVINRICDRHACDSVCAHARACVHVFGGLRAELTQTQAAVLGLDNIDLPHVNKSSATEMAQIAMTDSTARDLVADRFSTDYEVFGYSAR